MEAHAHAQPHTVRNYILVLCILGVLTFLEVMTYFIPWFQVEHRRVLFLAISVMGTIKFALVVAFYMHLRHDAVFYREVFIIPLVLAVIITLIVTMLTSIRLIPYQHI